MRWWEFVLAFGLCVLSLVVSILLVGVLVPVDRNEEDDR